MNVTPLNAAVCPKCRGRETFRRGTVRKPEGLTRYGHWGCRACHSDWLVPMLAPVLVGGSSE